MSIPLSTKGVEVFLGFLESCSAAFLMALFMLFIRLLVYLDQSAFRALRPLEEFWGLPVLFGLGGLALQLEWVYGRMKPFQINSHCLEFRFSNTFEFDDAGRTC